MIIIKILIFPKKFGDIFPILFLNNTTQQFYSVLKHNAIDTISLYLDSIEADGIRFECTNFAH